jgi:peptidoglycan/LPS O-acetylase OafA/YrhL
LSKTVLPQRAADILHGLRAVAAQSVCVGHAIVMFDVLPLVRPPHSPYIQNVGVLVFFFLSGFIICFSTLEKKSAKYEFRDFLIDRSVRIYTAYIPALIFIYLADKAGIWLSGGDGYYWIGTAKIALLNLLQLQDFPSVQVFGHDFRASIIAVSPLGSGRPLWTLAIEWWLYLFFAQCVFRPRSIWLALLYVLLAPFTLSIVAVNLFGGRGCGLAGIWFLGAATALALRAGWHLRLGTTALIACLACGCLGLAATLSRMGDSYALSFNLALSLCLGSFVMLLCVGYRAAQPDCNVLWRPPLRFMANCSFTLYLTHYTVLTTLIAAFGEQPGSYLAAAAAVVISNAVAIALALPTEMRYREIRCVLRHGLLRNILGPDRARAVS